MPDTLGSEEEHGSCVIFLLDTSNRKTSLAGDRKGGEEKYEKEEVEEEEKENEKEEKRILKLRSFSFQNLGVSNVIVLEEGPVRCLGDAGSSQVSGI